MWSLWLANLSWANQALYRENEAEVAEQLLIAMKNPVSSLKNGNLISIWSMDSDVENSFTKWYCTYGAARISPEFFPFVEENIQQRTWWGNAVDRCENAAATWYKIWSLPVQWSLVVYNAGGKFGSYGHVGKVLHYDKTHKKIIVRDMAWVGRWLMTDRREDITTSNVKCYIYNNRTEIIWEDIPSTTWTLFTTWASLTTWTTSPSHPAAPEDNEDNSIDNDSDTPSPDTDEPDVWTPSTGTNTTSNGSSDNTSSLEQGVLLTKEIPLRFDHVSDLASHFVSQYDISFVLVTPDVFTLWSRASLTLSISDKTTGKKYTGILPFSFTLVANNTTFTPSLSTIKFINKGIVTVPIIWSHPGTTTTIITMDDGTIIGEFLLTM